VLKRIRSLFESRKAAEQFPDRGPKVYAAEEGVTVYPARGPRQFMPWGSIHRVVIRSTALGMAAENVFWHLKGHGGEIVLPNEAEGMEDLLVWLQRLPDWDANAAIAAMSSTMDEEFLCWERR
jgi:hypothetical protein